MASPNDPNKPLGDRRKVEREVGGTMRWGWIWIVIAIIILLVVWFGGFGWGTYGGWWGSRSRQRLHTPASTVPPAMASQQPGNNTAVGGNGVQILASANKGALVGQPFDIRDVPITEKDGNNALWIAANNMEPMLVVLVGNEATQAVAGVAQGSRVNLTGTVERAPSAQIARKQWSLSADGTKRLEQEGAYVQATILQTTQP